MSAIEVHEQGLSCHAVNSVVVGELGEWEPVAPVGLSVIDKDPEILLNFLVDSFHLSIGLWVKSHGGILHDVEHLVKFFHELGDELGASIGDYCHGHAMSCINIVLKDPGPSFSREFGAAGDRNDSFRELVDYH